MDRIDLDSHFEVVAEPSAERLVLKIEADHQPAFQFARDVPLQSGQYILLANQRKPGPFFSGTLLDNDKSVSYDH